MVDAHVHVSIREGTMCVSCHVASYIQPPRIRLARPCVYIYIYVSDVGMVGALRHPRCVAMEESSAFSW